MIPKHVAIIMDGNGRWAEQRGLKRSDGHKAGSEALKKVVEYAFNNGIEALSVFAFSTENFKRSAEEVNYLMNLFVVVFKKYFNELHNKGIKIVFSKKEEGLPVNLEKLIKDITEKTKNNKKGIFNVCINYGGYDEIIDMTKKISAKVKNNELDINDINAHVINENLYQVLPPIDLVIRTSGEYRISNFMLLQMAYAELYFTNTYFPDFNDAEFEKALNEYKNRNRRFGGNT